MAQSKREGEGELVIITQVTYEPTRRGMVPRWTAMADTSEDNLQMRLMIFKEDQQLLTAAGWVDVLPNAGARERLSIPVITRWEQRNGWRIAEVLPRLEAVHHAE